MVARDLTKITTYTFRIWAYDETDDKLFGYSDYKTAKTWCDGKGVSCSGFVACDKCLGTSYCQHTWGANNGTEGITYVTLNCSDGRVRKANYLNYVKCGWCGVEVWAYRDTASNYTYVSKSKLSAARFLHIFSHKQVPICVAAKRN